MRLTVIAVLLTALLWQSQQSHINPIIKENQAVEQTQWIWLLHYTTNDYAPLNPRLFAKTNCRVLHFTFTNGLGDFYLFELSPKEFNTLWNHYPQFQQTNIVEFGGHP